MTYTLDVWFFPENRSARMPQAVSSHSDLDALLARLVEREQSRPAQIVARERPTVGPRNQPDTLIKLAVAGTGKVGALLFVSPESWAEPAEGDTSTGIYVTRAETAAPDAPTLFIDKATARRSPPTRCCRSNGSTRRWRSSGRPANVRPVWTGRSRRSTDRLAPRTPSTRRSRTPGRHRPLPSSHEREHPEQATPQRSCCRSCRCCSCSYASSDRGS